jgi:hypothetical protein
MADRLPAMTESAGTAGRIARTALKEIVKDAVREVLEEREVSSPGGESGTSSRGPPAGVGLLVVGILVGFLLARRSSKPDEAVEAIRERSPVGGETPGEPEGSDRTGRAGDPGDASEAGPSEDAAPEGETPTGT